MICNKLKQTRLKNIPEYDNYTIKNIEAIWDVTEKTQSTKFEDHFYGKNNTEGQITDFHSLGKPFRLAVIFDTHTEGVC